MKTRSQRPLSALTTLAIPLMAATGLGVPAASGQSPPIPTITNLGVLAGGAWVLAGGVSADGSVVVGSCLVQPGGVRAYRWQNGLMSSLGLISGGDFSAAYGVSADGLVVAGSATPSGSSNHHAFRWSSPGPIVDLGTLPSPYLIAEALGVSGNGQVVIGQSTQFQGANSRAFRWTATGMVNLGTLPGDTDSIAYAVNGDGSVVVGRSGVTGTAQAFRWTAASGMTSLSSAPGATGSVANGVSSDGSIVVGYFFTSPFAYHPFSWTAAGGMRDLGTLGGPGASPSIAYGVNASGNRIVGQSFTPGGTQHATLWTPELGLVDLNTYLPALGTDLTGWVLNSAKGISADGRIIVGDGMFNGFQRAWLVNLDLDTDGDGLLDNWETDGVPYIDSSGFLKRVPLPFANPLEKDLYVEVDAMAGEPLPSAAITRVVNAFIDSPVPNPSGIPLIHLHILEDENDLPLVSPWLTDGCWPLDFSTVRQAHFGTADERDDLDADLLLRAKAKAYRYCVIGKKASPRIGGCGQMPGDNFVVFLEDDPVVDSYAASKFMHELGHNLGLHHGGGDDINGKPNYPSIMNYTLSYPFDWNSSFWQLDFCSVGPPELRNLSENSLDEVLGIGTSGGVYSGYFMPFGVNIDVMGSPVRTLSFVNLNGSPTDFGNVANTGFQDGLFTPGVQQDLNYCVDPPLGISLPSESSPGQNLTAYNDWAHVVLPLVAVRAPAAIPAFPTDELTKEAVDWINQNFHAPPLPCYANCDASTASPILNANDFQCFLNKFAAADSYANCDGSSVAPVLNANDFQCFLNKFAAGCS